MLSGALPGGLLPDWAGRLPGMPPDWSTDGFEIDRLLVLVHLLMLALLVGWLAYFCVVLWRFRAGRRSAAVIAPPRGHLALGVAFLVFLCELGLMVLVEIPVWARRVAPPPDDAFVVRVVAEQFAWNFHYPGLDGEFGPTAIDRIASANPTRRASAASLAVQQPCLCASGRIGSDAEDDPAPAVESGVWQAACAA